MKKQLFLAALSLLMWGCGNDAEPGETPEVSISLTVTFAETQPVEMTAGETRTLAFAVAGSDLRELRCRAEAGAGWTAEATAAATPQGGYEGSVELTAPQTESQTELRLIITDRKDKEWTATLQVQAALPPVTAIDLSAAGTANCYLVNAGGEYMFDASVRGNGKGDSASITLAQDMNADWLWATKGLETGLTGIRLDAKRNKIFFTAADGLRGNALLVLTQATGEIVWSWHLWFSDRPQELTYPNGRTLMDRNLGATGTTPGDAATYGLYFQWGRKDPFFGGTTTETSTTAFAQAEANTVVNPAYSASHGWKQESGAAVSTLEYASSHPMSFFSNSSATGIYDWLAAGRADLWSSDKTHYDPCPAGYKVPDANTWDGFADDQDRYIDGTTEWDGTRYGVAYSGGGITDWYPTQGYRNRDKGNLVGLATTRTGHYWSNLRTGNTITYFYISKKLSTGKLLQPQSTSKSDPAYGYNVRCCRE